MAQRNQKTQVFARYEKIIITSFLINKKKRLTNTFTKPRLNLNTFCPCLRTFLMTANHQIRIEDSKVELTENYTDSLSINKPN